MISFNDVASQWNEIEERALPDLLNFLRRGPYINGQNVKEFEKEFAAWCQANYAIGVSNGTDGLKLALQALDPPQQTTVIMAANAYIADALAAEYNNLDIRFVDCDQWYGIDVEKLKSFVEKLPDNRTIVIIAVHLYGQPCNITGIKSECPDAIIIEDCSQATGATIEGKPVGTFGDMGVFSLYPTKNLGATGDAGIIVTNDYELCSKITMLREYGTIDKSDYTCMGWNNRLDEIQALILRHKLSLVNSWNEKKRKIASIYCQKLEGVGDIILPQVAPWADDHTWHLYPVRTEQRDSLRAYMKSVGIPTLIHYPKPLHRTTFFYRDMSFPKSEEYARTILSLPMHPYMNMEDVQVVIDAIKSFFKK